MNLAPIHSLRGRFLLANVAVLGAFTVLAAACSDDSSLPPAADDNVGGGGGGTPVVTRDASSDADAADASTEADGSNDADSDGAITPSDAGADGSDGQVGDAPPESRCRSTADCTDPKLGCFFYVEPNCDPQTTTFCQTDSECGTFESGIVCDQPRPSCGTACIPGCTTNDDCNLGWTCSDVVKHHCVRTSCTSAADCPNENFMCKASPQGSFCERRSCTTDEDCNGRCVTEKNALGSYCIEDWGFCAQQ